MDDPEYADLKEWRLAHNLSPQPDIAIVSNSLRFPIPDVLTAGGRKVIVFTKTNPDPERVKEIEASAGQVVIAGESSVAGDQMVQQMVELGYQNIYSTAGPKILHMLLDGGVLDRLYLTQVNRLLAGQPYSTIVEESCLRLLLICGSTKCITIRMDLMVWDNSLHPIIAPEPIFTKSVYLKIALMLFASTQFFRECHSGNSDSTGTTDYNEESVAMDMAIR